MRKIQKRKKWKRGGVIRRGDEEKSGKLLEKRKALGEN